MIVVSISYVLCFSNCGVYINASPFNCNTQVNPANACHIIDHDKSILASGAIIYQLQAWSKEALQVKWSLCVNRDNSDKMQYYRFTAVSLRDHEA